MVISICLEVQEEVVVEVAVAFASLSEDHELQLDEGLGAEFEFVGGELAVELGHPIVH